MSENPNRTYAEFAAHIQHETQKARREARRFIGNPKVLNIGCIDPLTTNYQWNPPGGGIFIDYEGLLPAFYEVRRGKSGVLAVHLNCGYLTVVHGLRTIAEQSAAIEGFKDRVQELNQQFEAHFQIVIEHQGSAAPYMLGRF